MTFWWRPHAITSVNVFGRNELGWLATNLLTILYPIVTSLEKEVMFSVTLVYVLGNITQKVMNALQWHLMGENTVGKIKNWFNFGGDLSLLSEQFSKGNVICQMLHRVPWLSKHRSRHHKCYPKYFSSNVMVKNVSLQNSGQHNAFRYVLRPHCSMYL